MLSLSKENQLQLDQGKVLPIMEDFYTLQGEGAHTGKASYFIRIGGCDVGCHWCDVKESWDAKKHPLTPVDHLIQRIPDIVNLVVLTGGEPSMYNLSYITQRLKEKRIAVHIETSGAYEIKGDIDWICLSPKKRQLPIKKVIEAANELKCIIFNQHDFNFAEEYASQVNESCELYLQPEWSKAATMTPKIIEYILENPQWRISIQTHKHLNIP